MNNRLCRSFLLTLLTSLACIIFVAFTPAMAMVHSFSNTNYAGTSMTYSLATNGSVEHYSDRNLTATRHFTFSATVQFHLSQAESDGTIPITIDLRPNHAVGLPTADPLRAVQLQGHVSSNGLITTTDTPEFLAALGLDMDQLLMGWAVPSPLKLAEGPVSTWQVSIDRDRTVSLGTPFSYALTGNYQSIGSTPFSSRRVTNLLATFRGDASVYDGDRRIRTRELGSGNFDVDPDNGITAVSSISLVSTVDIDDNRTMRSTRMKISTTTTLELLEVSALDPSVASPTSPAPLTNMTTDPVQPTDSQSDATELGDLPGSMDPTLIEPADPSEPKEPSPDVSEPSKPGPDAFDDVPAHGREETTISEIESEPMDGGAVPKDPPADPLTAEPSGDPSSPMTQPDSPQNFYSDPANRFELVLPSRLQLEHDEPHVSLRGTRFSGPGAGEYAYVYVTPLSDVRADAAQIVHSILINYNETLPGFALLGGPTPDQLGGVAAYRAHYEYLNEQGQSVTEWGIFARKGERIFFVQYTPGIDDIRDGERVLLQLRDGFSFGPDLHGQIPVTLLSDSLALYVDEHRQFQMLVPSYWPLAERADGGASTTFTEIGEKGYMTIFIESGAADFSARQVLEAWNEEWKREEGYELIEDLTDIERDGLPATTFTYSWTGSANVSWTRRVDAMIDRDTFYAIVIDYVSDGYADRWHAFEKMVASFHRLPPPDMPDELEPDQPESSIPMTEGDASHPISETEHVETDHYPFDEPTDEERVILIGRVLTRYPGEDGQMVESWGSDLNILVRAGEQEIQGISDEYGYVYVANLPPLDDDEYEVLRFTGYMLGIEDPVELNFVDLFVGVDVPRVSNLDILVITLTDEYTVQVNIIGSHQGMPDEASPSDYFIRTFPNSEWSDYVRQLHHE